ncbi:MAG: hypothetical protein QM820_55605 [Minicystis sp.]
MHGAGRMAQSILAAVSVPLSCALVACACAGPAEPSSGEAGAALVERLDDIWEPAESTVENEDIHAPHFRRAAPSSALERFVAQMKSAHGWTVYTTGTCAGRGARRLDESCMLVAIPRGGDSDKGTWVRLPLTKLWLRGVEKTLQGLEEIRRLTRADLLVIAQRLHESRSEKELPRIPGDILPKGDEDVGWHGDDIGAPPRQTQDAAPSVRVIGPSQPPVALPVPLPFRGGTIGTPAQNHPSTQQPVPFGKPGPMDGSDRELLARGLSPAQIHAWRAGTLPADRYPDTRPRRYERTSVFVCEGRTWWGYPEDCPDFGASSSLERWRDVLDAEIYDWAKENLFADGSKPACAQHCEYLAQRTPAGMRALVTVGVAVGLPAGASTLFGEGGPDIWGWLLGREAVIECKRAYCD